LHSRSPAFLKIRESVLAFVPFIMLNIRRQNFFQHFQV